APSANGPELIIRVQDDGKGIDPARIKAKLEEKGVHLPSWDDKSLLDSLFMDDMSLAHTITDISGRGVGLSAVKEMVLASGGRLEVKTKLGEGTCFEIVLPYVKEPKILHLPQVPSKAA
ncbi:MAG: ATP-binding protein, partial [Bdellovibrionota bacterium]